MRDEGQEQVTARQRDVLREIARLEARQEVVTTARLANNLNIPRQNMRTYLLALRDKGLVLYEANARQSAAIRITESGRARLSGKAGTPSRPGGTPQNVTLSLPILGEVAAGQPGWADQHVEGYAARLQDLLDVHEGDFLLRVRGDSMIGVGIYPGDLVVIRPMLEEPQSGEIALVTVPGEDTATLKRWQRRNGMVSLISENPAYKPMTYPVSEVQMQGCLVGHIGTGRARRTQNGSQEG